MNDDKTQTGNPDRSRINLNEDYEVKDWSTKFSVSAAELVMVVRKVGSNAADVEAFLKRERDSKKS